MTYPVADAPGQVAARLVQRCPLIVATGT